MERRTSRGIRDGVEALRTRWTMATGGLVDEKRRRRNASTASTLSQLRLHELLRSIHRDRVGVEGRDRLVAGGGQLVYSGLDNPTLSCIQRPALSMRYGAMECTAGSAGIALCL